MQGKKLLSEIGRGPNLSPQQQQRKEHLGEMAAPVRGLRFATMGKAQNVG